MEDDRGHLERRLADVEDVLRRGNYRWTVAQIAEARDAIGAARRAMQEMDSALLSYQLSRPGSEFSMDIDRIRASIPAYLAKLEGGG